LQCLFILTFSHLLSWSLFNLLKLPASIDMHVLLFIMTDYDVRLIVRVRSVGLHFWLYNMVALPSWLVSTDFGTYSYQCSSIFISSSLHTVNCSWAHTLWCLLSILFFCHHLLLLLLLLLLSSSSSVSPLCKVFTLIFLRQTMSLGSTVLQLFWCYYSWCSYRYFLRWLHCISTLALSALCVQCLIWLFSVVP
jgi:hypothetical protein